MLSYSKNGVRIEGYPRQDDHFKSLVLQKKRVHVLQVFGDGTREKKIWNALQFKETSDLRRNLETGYASPKYYPGIVQAHFAIEESDLPNEPLAILAQKPPLNSTMRYTARTERYSSELSKNFESKKNAHIAYQGYIRDDKRDDAHLAEAKRLAEMLHHEMNKEEIYAEIRAKDVIGASSQVAKIYKSASLHSSKSTAFQRRRLVFLKGLKSVEYDQTSTALWVMARASSSRLREVKRPLTIWMSSICGNATSARRRITFSL